MLLIITILSTYIIYNLITGYLVKHKPCIYLKLSKKLHLPSQVLPPFLILLFITSNGPGLWFSMVILLFVILFSLISLIIKIFNLKNNKTTLIRPLLSLIFVGVIIGFANNSIKVAEAQAFELTGKIKNECLLKGVCPTNISNWLKPNTKKSYKTRVAGYLGGYVTYPIMYTNKENEFTLYLYQSLDMGTMYSAGIDKPISIVNN